MRVKHRQHAKDIIWRATHAEHKMLESARGPKESQSMYLSTALNSHFYASGLFANHQDLAKLTALHMRWMDEAKQNPRPDPFPGRKDVLWRATQGAHDMLERAREGTGLSQRQYITNVVNDYWKKRGYFNGRRPTYHLPRVPGQEEQASLFG